MIFEYDAQLPELANALQKWAAVAAGLYQEA